MTTINPIGGNIGNILNTYQRVEGVENKVKDTEAAKEAKELELKPVEYKKQPEESLPVYNQKGGEVQPETPGQKYGKIDFFV